jgi:rhodanese-related sulfurtransferase
MIGALKRLFGKAQPEPELEPAWVDVAALRRQLAGDAAPWVIDVRGPDEFDGPLGHIEGALNVPLPVLAIHEPQIAAARRPVVCVCLTDKRSSAAAARLAAAGVAEVRVLRGGMKAWRAAGL